MVKSGRTRAWSRGTHQEGQRQPVFDTTDAPDAPGTNASTVEEGYSHDGTPPGQPEEEGTQDAIEERGEHAQGGMGEQRGAAGGQRGDRGGWGETASSTDRQGETEGESEEGSLSEDSEDSQGRVGEEKEQRIYWNEVGKKLETEGVGGHRRRDKLGRRGGGNGSGTAESEAQGKGGSDDQTPHTEGEPT
eukprot:6182771-Pleurochrysis_carterae.AAC.2